MSQATMKTFLRGLASSSFLRFAAFSAVAAVAAFQVSEWSGFASPAIAGVTAMISVRPTFHDTAAESLRQVLGTLLGALIAVALGATFGFTWWTLVVMVLSAFGLARLLRLGESGGTVMGLTTLLVVGPGFDTIAMEQRLAGVAFGAVAALLVSLWVRPGKPHDRALAASVQHSKDSAELLSEISTHLSEHGGSVTRKVAKEWVARAERTLRELAEVREDAEGAWRASRWSPLVNREEAKTVVEQISIAQVTARTVYNMAHDLLTASRKNKGLPSSLAQTVASVVAATAESVAEQADGASSNSVGGLDAGDEVIRDWTARHDKAAAKTRSLEDTGPLLLAGSILRDTEKILDAVTGDASTSSITLPPQKPARKRRSRQAGK